jgi:hypothetical protein
VTIATQQPVARDLRYLLTLDHVSYELERIGDHASSVAKQVVKLAPEPPLGGYIHLPEMAERGAGLICSTGCSGADRGERRRRPRAGQRRRCDRPPLSRHVRSASR